MNCDLSRATLTLLLLAGAAFRIFPLTDNRFHQDEALFSTLARLIAGGADPMLAHTSLLVDKPPLFYYTLALSVISFGGREIALRLPGLLMSIISIALIARLSWRLWGSWSAIIVTELIVAFSPFSILFSPTVFSDPQYMFWLLASAVAISERRWGWAGILSGFALASKQSAGFFLPLVLLIGMCQALTPDHNSNRLFRMLIRFLAGFGLILLLVVIWDHLRAPAASFWVAALDANNPGRLVRSAEVWPRASAWLAWASTFTGSPIADVAVIAMMVSAAPLEIIANPMTRRAANTLVITTMLLAYIASIWFVAFPLLDRYLLPVITLSALLAGRGAGLLASLLQPRVRSRWARAMLAAAALMGLLAVLLPGSVRTAQNGYPVGGDHGAYAGIERIASFLADRPMGTVVYSHDLSWHAEFYLFDAYIYRAYFQSPGQLAGDLYDFGSSPDERYVILSVSESELEIAEAVAGVGYRLTPIDLGVRSYLQLFRLDRSP